MTDTQLHARPGRSKKQLVIGGKVYKSANDWKITDEILDRASDELGETEEKKERCLQELKELLSKETEECDVIYRTDDAYLLRFLRFRKYDVEKAYQNVKQFYYLRNLKPDFYTLPPNLKSAQDMTFVYYMPYTDEEDRMVVCMDFSKWNVDENSFEEMCQITTTITDIMTMNPKTQINGITGIWDMKSLTATHLTELLRKNRLQTFVSLAQNSYPWRIKKILVPNANRLTRMLYKIIKPLIRKKIADRVVLLGPDLSELHKYINPVLLPESLGGTLLDEECNVTQHVLENMQFLEYERSFISG